MIRFVCLSLCLLPLIHALAASPQISEVVPSAVFLENSGRQVNIILRGSGLNEIKELQIRRGGVPVPSLFARVGVPSDTRRGATLIASEKAPLGGEYQIMLLLRDGTEVPLSLPLSVVPVGDPKATAADTASLLEAAKVASGQRMVISERVAPVITGTQPSPLSLPPASEPRTILIQGRNLKDITEVRVRKADKPARYQGKQGLVPHRITEQGVEVDLQVGASAVRARFTSLIDGKKIPGRFSSAYDF
ncbi:MAG: hypothetical protein HC904_14250 [Blastochloris sp.]|nr:hypothetical protein [Blastochloris sp.]